MYNAFNIIPETEFDQRLDFDVDEAFNAYSLFDKTMCHSGPPGGRVPLGSGDRPLFGPSQAPNSLFSSDYGLTHVFRAGHHEGSGFGHINYETYAGTGPISGPLQLGNIHIDVPVVKPFYDENGDINLGL